MVQSTPQAFLSMITLRILSETTASLLREISSNTNLEVQKEKGPSFWQECQELFTFKSVLDQGYKSFVKVINFSSLKGIIVTMLTRGETIIRKIHSKVVHVRVSSSPPHFTNILLSDIMYYNKHLPLPW